MLVGKKLQGSQLAFFRLKFNRFRKVWTGEEAGAIKALTSVHNLLVCILGVCAAGDDYFCDFDDFSARKLSIFLKPILRLFYFVYTAVVLTHFQLLRRKYLQKAPFTPVKTYLASLYVHAFKKYCSTVLCALKSVAILLPSIKYWLKVVKFYLKLKYS
jgi:hypothetical protein